jgi:exonuclease SbcD
MKFAHFADCHIGGWREPKLRDLNTLAFEKAVDFCIRDAVDFIVIAGDLFNSSLPSLDCLKSAVSRLRVLKENGIPVYIVAGSHDFSPSGKTMIDILEEAGLVVNVARCSVVDDRIVLSFVQDKKTCALIAGVPGRKGALEKNLYENLSDIAGQDGYRIFIFHTALTEFKPKDCQDMESAPLSLLPKGFDYYAGGHVHYVFSKDEPGYGTIAFPGPLFPNNFKELDELGTGGFYIMDDGRLRWEPVQVMNTLPIVVDCHNLMVEQVEQEFFSLLKNHEFNETIVTLRFVGTLRSGKPSDIDMKKFFDALYQKSAYFVMKNTSKLLSHEFVEVKVDAGSVEETESRLIAEHAGNLKGFEEETRLVRELMLSMDKERDEGEKVSDFEKRLLADIGHILKNQP